MSFRSGDSYGVCQRCGWRYYMSELKKESTGLLVCSTCYDEPHPQERLRLPVERSPKRISPEGQDYFLTAGEVKAEDL